MLEIVDLCKSFGALQVTHHVTMNLKKGERRVVLGPNGAGKTTLFRLLAGTLKPSSGRIIMDGMDITTMPIHKRARQGLARSYQQNNPFGNLTLGENIALAVAAHLGLSSSLWRDTHRLPQIQERVQKIATQTHLEALLNEKATEVSYGNRRQLEVAIALATEPKLLLLDEPTSGIGPDAVKQLHGLLTNLPKDLTLLIIEHDMDLAFDIADSISVLNYGEIIFEGTADEVRNNKQVNDIYLGSWDHAGD